MYSNFKPLVKKKKVNAGTLPKVLIIHRIFPHNHLKRYSCKAVVKWPYIIGLYTYILSWQIHEQRPSIFFLSPGSRPLSSSHRLKQKEDPLDATVGLGWLCSGLMTLIQLTLDPKYNHFHQARGCMWTCWTFYLCGSDRTLLMIDTVTHAP